MHNTHYTCMSKRKMGSNYYGDQTTNLGSERGARLSSSSSSSSSRKGKKSNSDNPKQPQRGLGVAQLEKIRLHSQLGGNYLPSVHNPYTLSFTLQEDIRMQTAYSSSTSSFSYSSSSSPSYVCHGPHGVMMGMPDLDRTNIRYGDTQSSSTARWNRGNAGMGTQHFVEPIITRPFFESIPEGSIKKKNKTYRNDSKGLSSQNPESSSFKDIDLELKLSL